MNKPAFSRMVGEFGVRAPAKHGGFDGANGGRREGALSGLVRFVRRNPVEFAEACRFGRVPSSP